mmetsp:Transcript_5866/g.15080  ORF Transcript_5866/g.15080 Transcript_5866/m.15080 type:complete len:210 (+) Transcript_5866:153-782(+)
MRGLRAPLHPPLHHGHMLPLAAASASNLPLLQTQSPGLRLLLPNSVRGSTGRRHLATFRISMELRVHGVLRHSRRAARQSRIARQRLLHVGGLAGGAFLSRRCHRCPFLLCAVPFLPLLPQLILQPLNVGFCQLQVQLQDLLVLCPLALLGFPEALHALGALPLALQRLEVLLIASMHVLHVSQLPGQLLVRGLGCLQLLCQLLHLPLV